MKLRTLTGKYKNPLGYLRVNPLIHGFRGIRLAKIDPSSEFEDYAALACRLPGRFVHELGSLMVRYISRLNDIFVKSH